jgi:putative DNA primase/helicase
MSQPKIPRITLPAAMAARVARFRRRRLKILVAALKDMQAAFGYDQPTQAERAALKAELADALTQWADTQTETPVTVTRRSSRLQRLWNLAIRIDKCIARIEEDATQTVVRRLARFSPAAYDRAKHEETRKLGVNLGTLNDLVNQARADLDAAEADAAVLPWPHPVDGATLLDELAVAVRRHVVMTDDQAFAVALWIVHCWAIAAFPISPRLLARSVTKQAGKTTLRDVLLSLVPKPLCSDNASPAAIFRATHRRMPTLLLDEADTWVRRDQQIRGLINSGHRRGGWVMRMDRGVERHFSTFAPLMLALIGRAADTVEDRSITIHLKRRRTDETREPFSLTNTEHLEELARRARRWAEDHLEALRTTKPIVPLLGDRAEDNWRPLLAIADEAGRGTRARHAAERLAAVAVAEATDVIERLVLDIYAVLPTGVDRITSVALAKALGEIDSSPWAEYRGSRAITKKQLSGLLAKFLSIRSVSIRLRGQSPTAKGYYVEQFADAFARYAGQIGTTAPTPQAAQTQGRADGGDDIGCADVPNRTGGRGTHAP